MTQPPRQPGLLSIIAALARIARGRPEGLEYFDATGQAFLASLAPLIAFPLMGAVLLLVRGEWHDALADLAISLCALLTPPAVSYELARFWGREAHWLRFAIAFNWCQWLLLLVFLLLLVAVGTLAAGGLLDQRGGALAIIVGAGCYGLWLHWFLARHGLALTAGRAVALVVTVNCAVALLVYWLPRVVGSS